MVDRARAIRYYCSQCGEQHQRAIFYGVCVTIATNEAAYFVGTPQMGQKVKRKIQAELDRKMLRVMRERDRLRSIEALRPIPITV